MKLEFHPAALLEYEDAVSFYEDRQAGLGNRFILAVEHALSSIRESPERWPFLEQDVRRRLTPVFPYAVLYTAEDTHVLVLTVMHCRRKPGHWRKRRET